MYHHPYKGSTSKWMIGSWRVKQRAKRGVCSNEVQHLIYRTVVMKGLTRSGEELKGVVKGEKRVKRDRKRLVRNNAELWRFREDLGWNRKRFRRGKEERCFISMPTYNVCPFNLLQKICDINNKVWCKTSTFSKSPECIFTIKKSWKHTFHPPKLPVNFYFSLFKCAQFRFCINFYKKYSFLVGLTDLDLENSWDGSLGIVDNLKVRRTRSPKRFRKKHGPF